MLMMRCALFLILYLGICPVIYAQDDAFSMAQCYIKAYPEFFKGYKDGYLITKDGRKIRFDDGVRSKDYNKMIVDHHISDKAFDPEDALYWNYDAGKELPTADNPPAGDPGRIRPAEVFKYMYGETKSERRKKMRPVHWIGSEGSKKNTMLITTVNGIDKAIEDIAQELKNLPEEKKRLLQGIVFNVDAYSGYYERPVRDYPQRNSAHSYGIEIGRAHV